jgi:sugar (pentulose or hexulose) kinase
VGTSRVKLVAYGEDFSVMGFASERSPLRLSGEAAVQDAAQLAGIFRSFVRRASEWGCRAVGVSVYRGSMVAWDAGGRPVSDVITWLDRRTLRVYEELPAAAKLASHLPVNV